MVLKGLKCWPQASAGVYKGAQPPYLADKRPEGALSASTYKMSPLQVSMAQSEEECSEVRERLQLLIQCAIINVDVYERETRHSKIHR